MSWSHLCTHVEFEISRSHWASTRQCQLLLRMVYSSSFCRIRWRVLSALCCTDASRSRLAVCEKNPMLNPTSSVAARVPASRRQGSAHALSDRRADAIVIVFSQHAADFRQPQGSPSSFATCGSEQSNRGDVYSHPHCHQRFFLPISLHGSAMEHAKKLRCTVCSTTRSTMRPYCTRRAAHRTAW